MVKGICTLIAGVGFLASTSACAQSPAALSKLQQRYSPEQVEEMRIRGHYKYAGLLLFYGSSFQVEEGGQFRPANEDEILAIDLHAHDAIRDTNEDVVILDPALNRQVMLLSRNRFEGLMLESLSSTDRADYLAYKSRALQDTNRKDQ
ncbi:MAG: hypothetical protein IPM46_05760 [Flavobacteriales bacterium]|nr:hypothetical protein [Flavobacteriales bacterium]